MRWKYYVSADECWGPGSLEELKDRAGEYFYIDWDSKKQMANGLIQYTSSRSNLHHLFIPATHPMFNLDEFYGIETAFRYSDYERVLRMFELEGG